MDKQQIGLVGLAVMGENLVLNIERNGFGVAVFNRTTEKVTKFMEGRAAGRNIKGALSIKELVDSLESPRRIMLMVKAGQPVDDFIEQLRPLLSAGDILIDGGNSYYKDTVRRNRSLAADGLLYIGTGVSGGEEGALWGPAIMPGGQQEAYDAIAPVLTKIAAHVEGEPCCSYIGQDGAGHYVKMVHNGIEYGDMQLICEAYFIMANALAMSAGEMHEVFAEWNKGELNSYLIEITANILSKVDDETGKPIVDLILDTAGQKGTGKWTSQEALDLGVPAPTIAEAVFARCLSAIKEERVAAAKKLRGPRKRYRGDKDKFIEAIRQALFASKICSYAQGFALMDAAGKENAWDLDFGGIAKLWRGGCIIRARFLHQITDAYERDSHLDNLLLDPYFNDVVKTAQPQWRKVVSTAVNAGIPVPAFSSAISYFDGYRQVRLPANLLQAQRDYFGAHTYLRVDKPGQGPFHTEWTAESS
ncbi:MAG: decarboxylating NADP(+)-dependent phosphogluconate dehydrogenase [Phycisphaerae bacterium]|nr:decarboxylating NADP(+)-dependent phosphogluconate dehydrogenase [Phycisphaerae bacterium]